MDEYVTSFVSKITNLQITLVSYFKCLNEFDFLLLIEILTFCSHTIYVIAGRHCFIRIKIRAL